MAENIQYQRDRMVLTMARRKTHGKRGSSVAKSPPVREPRAAGVLDRLAFEEANAVLRRLLDTHPELRPEAEQIATDHMASSSAEDVATDVFHRVTGIDLDALNGRAGTHSWGYVEPGQAAMDLLVEAVEDFVEDMKRKAELGLESAAEVACAGIVQGLYRAEKTRSDGALGWAPDFPGEEAGFVVEELIRSSRPKVRRVVGKRLIEILATQAPEWEDFLRRAVHSSIGK
jgi:hypothetical protein